MTGFAQRCGVHDAAATAAVLLAVEKSGLDSVRIAWCDVHGLLRAKTLLPHALPSAFESGVGMVGTLLLKDTSDRTAFNVFDDAGVPDGFAGASNLLMLPDPASFRVLPWAPGTGWLQAQPWFADATPVSIDPRRVLQSALATLAGAGWTLRCGLEVEFHIHRITDDRQDPHAASQPGEPPTLALVHPGWQLLGEACADLAAEPLAIVRRTAVGLGLPLRSLEIELGPSQFEAVFDATDALAAADHMALFRSGVKQALRRAGYHASFVCLPPFGSSVAASGWHLHQSLLKGGVNAFTPADASAPLSRTGMHWLAGLLAHACGASLCATPTVNGHARFRPGTMAPVVASWGRDDRSALLRVLGGPGDAATRIENRGGEPMACPYLYIAAQIHAGLDGLRRELQPPAQAEPLPTTLLDAIAAFEADTVLTQGLGAPMARTYAAIKRSEAARHAAADDSAAWQRREYFSRY